MIILAFVIGVSSISLSYFRTHHRLLPLTLLTVGFLIIIAGHLYITNWIEGIVVPLGGLTIATAHFINYKFACNCKVHDHGEHIRMVHGN